MSDLLEINNLIQCLLVYNVKVVNHAFVIQSFKFHLKKIIDSSDLKFMTFIGQKQVKTGRL